MGFLYNRQLLNVRPTYDQSYNLDQNKRRIKKAKRFIHRATVNSSTHPRLSLEDRLFLQSIGLTPTTDKRD